MKWTKALLAALLFQRALTQMASVSAYMHQPTEKHAKYVQQVDEIPQTPELFEQFVVNNLKKTGMTPNEIKENIFEQNKPNVNREPTPGKNNKNVRQGRKNTEQGKNKKQQEENSRKRRDENARREVNKGNISWQQLLTFLLSGFRAQNNNDDVESIIQPIEEIELQPPLIQQIINQALQDIEETTQVRVDFELNNNMNRSNEAIDDVLTTIVKVFNNTETRKQIKLFNGIDRRILVHPAPLAANNMNGYKVYNMIRLGHMLVPVSQATLSRQLGLTNVNIKRNMRKKNQNQVLSEGVQKGLEEVQQFDASIRKHVLKTKSVLQVISYPLGQKMRYFPSNPMNHKVPAKQYLYQGVLHPDFRSVNSFCYVLSRFPPTVRFDILDTQRYNKTQSVNKNRSLQDTVTRSILKKKWKPPRILKKSTPEDLGILATMIIAGSTMFSSSLLILL